MLTIKALVNQKINQLNYMKNLFTISCICLAAIILLLSTAKADSVDQSNYTGTANVGFGESNNLKYSCQGFKPTYNQITAVSFHLAGIGNQGMRVWIDNANSNSNPTGTLEQGLGHTNIPNSQLSASLTKYNLSAPIFVTPNAQYVFCLAPWNTTTNTYSTNYRDLKTGLANHYANGKVANYHGGTLTWSNPDSGNADRVFEVWGENVNPIISSFSASPATITEGQSTTLSFTASKYTSLTINNGVGDVSGLTTKVVSPTVTTTYLLTATNTVGTATASFTVNVNPLITPTWDIQSVDVMKYSKDVVCNPPSDTTITNMVQKAKDLGANYIALSTPYDNPSGCNSQLLTQRWVNEIRAKGLKVWHRHMTLAFEGIYSTAKHRSPDGYRHLKIISDWITNNKTLIQPGDLFTPMPEPQNGGINGVTYCGNPSVCMFSHAADFNEWLRMADLTTELALKSNDISSVSVGYWGFDGFITWCDANPDCTGTSKLENATVVSMDDLITIDHYPVGGATMSGDLNEARAVWPTKNFLIGEWGTISVASDSAKATLTQSTFEAFATRSWIKGVNYWHLGPGGNEGLLNNDYTEKPHFDVIETFYK